MSVALADGSCLEDCELVSAGRDPVDSVWLFVDGVDTFVAAHDITDLWEWPFRKIRIS